MNIGLQFGWEIKSAFFDRDKVLRAVKKATRRALIRSGFFVRRVAQRSMKKTRGPSAPGSPPHAHEGHLRRFIFFAYDRPINDVVVGPVAFRRRFGGMTLPELMEFGGRIRIKRRSKRTKKQKMVVAMYPARPFMHPALERSRPRIAEFWRDSLEAS